MKEQENNSLAEGMNQTKNKIKKGAKFIAGIALDIATGNISAAIAKIAIKAATFLFIFLFGFIIIISCMFEIIFSELGFESSASYAEESRLEEENQIKTTILSCYGKKKKDTARANIDFFIRYYDGNNPSAHNIDEDGNAVQLPSSGNLAEYYKEIDDDYTARWESAKKNENKEVTIVYKGYEVICDYDSFWEKSNYVAIFTSIIQNSATNKEIEKICSGDTEQLQKTLGNYIDSFDFSSIVNIEEPPKIEYEDVKKKKKTVRNTFITYELSIDFSKLAPASAGESDNAEEEYLFTKTEKTLDLSVEFLSDLEAGNFGAAIMDLLTLNGAELKEKLETVKNNIFNDSRFSYRAIKESNGDIANSQSNNFYMIGNFSLGEAVVAYAEQHVGDEYDQSRRMAEGVYDCSSLVARAYQSAGFGDFIMADGWAYTAAAEYNYCKENGQILSSADELMPGDLIFTTGNKQYGVGHVIIYAGDEKIIHARSSKYGVVKEKFKEPGNLVAYARPYIPQATTGDLSTEQGMYEFLISYGFTPAGASGILGNIFVESSLDPNAYNASGGYYGLGQWNKSRQEDLKSYCNTYGFDYTTREGQINFLVYELAGYTSLYQYLQSEECTDPDMAAQEFCCGFEGCYGETGVNDAEYHGSLYPKRVGVIYQSLGARIAHAVEIYSSFTEGD